MAEISKEKKNTFSLELVNSIKEFYRDDSNSRICAGIKEYVSVLNEQTQEKEHRQKRLLLYNLKDLHTKFIKDNSSHINPSFSAFASLHPRECVLAGSPGTHSICICSQHQNIKLKLKALNPSIAYREILTCCVCSVDSRDCMLHLCEKCPGKQAIHQYLQENDYLNKRSNITYSNWTSTNIKQKKETDSQTSESINRVTLKNVEETMDAFIEKLENELWDLTEHHFISECQKNFLSEMKQNLHPDTCIMLMDFAENYSFIHLASHCNLL